MLVGYISVALILVQSEYLVFSAYVHRLRVYSWETLCGAVFLFMRITV